MIRALIVDDEKYIRDELRYFLEKDSCIEVCGEASEGEDALKRMLEELPDVVFLDIQLQDVNGILVARKMMEQKNPAFIVFVTAYEKYAIQGFEVNALDYLLKPFSEDRIRTTIQRIKEGMNSRAYRQEPLLKAVSMESKPDKLCVLKNDRILLLDINEVLYIESQNNEVFVYAQNGKYQCNYSLKEIEDRFTGSKFIRTHKSFIVNLDYISEIIPWFNYTLIVKLKGRAGIEIPVSRSYLKKFKELLGL